MICVNRADGDRGVGPRRISHALGSIALDTHHRAGKRRGVREVLTGVRTDYSALYGVLGGTTQPLAGYLRDLIGEASAEAGTTRSSTSVRTEVGRWLLAMVKGTGRVRSTLGHRSVGFRERPL